jgi:1-acyl-sn-glycerol-3-phosphate acyltransferase
MEREKAFNILGRLINWLSDLKVIGHENVPPSGPALLVINHISRLDTPFIMYAGGRYDVIPVVAREYKNTFFLGWALNLLRVIWITRGTYDFEAFCEAKAYLNKGWVIGLAPEGTRSRDGLLHEGKPGSALLAYKMGVPLLAGAVSGTDTMSKTLLRLRKMKVTVEFGKMFRLPDKEGLDNKVWLNLATDEIMCHIAAILPPERRGFYADYPRVQEILAEQQVPATSEEKMHDPAQG